MSRLPLPYTVTKREEETADTVSLTLEPVAEPLPPFTPGQFAMVYGFPRGEVPLSVSGTTVTGRGLVHTVRAVGAVTRALHALRAGQQVGVRGPFGTGWDLPAARGHDVLVVAGGLGLAPLRPLIQRVLADAPQHGSVSVLIGARTPADLLYREQSREWGRTARVAVTVDRPAPDWTGEVGVVTDLLDRTPRRPGRTTAFLCGPEVMMRATARELVQRGIPAARVRLSLERTMRCGTGHCGQCQLGPLLLCRDGPVIGWDRAAPLLSVREL
ncbi:FAD/NAD(P)-binding protein [Streptomyces xiamenensis]|uniref:Anaerobic sulfite reductase subunit B n=1 Tax=Streptomyces xiamenensis TaxID=408015 RepID=A0A0F7G2H8_9ACTN|nr:MULTISPECIES: FAD/NAD(P)-binding protein [Streptomyces]AKG46813.1 anaerobic sulfite reductase subunit B [Streptomyces xiamenensis]